MLSVTFDAIYSRFLSKVQAYDLLELASDNCYEQMNEWLKSVKSDSRVRKIFTSLSFDDIQKTVSFELRNPVDDSNDTDFVIEIFGLGIAWKWVEPKYKSVLLTAQAFMGSHDMKFFSQQAHMAELANMYKCARTDLYSYIASHGYYNNSYLKEGE